MNMVIVKCLLTAELSQKQVDEYLELWKDAGLSWMQCQEQKRSFKRTVRVIVQGLTD
jgi:hypothetical protein